MGYLQDIVSNDGETVSFTTKTQSAEIDCSLTSGLLWRLCAWPLWYSPTGPYLISEV